MRGVSNSVNREPPGVVFLGDVTSVASARSNGVSSDNGWATGRSYGEGSSKATSTGRAATESYSATHGSSIAETEGRSHATTTGHSSGTTVGHSIGRETGQSVGRTTGKSVGRETGKSIGYTLGRSIGQTSTAGATTGKTDTAGFSESIEPIYETLPTAVHSKENATYMAAQTLRSLTTGRALINYVGQTGMNTAMITVPRVQSTTVLNEQFDRLRNGIFIRSPSAIATEHAIAMLEEREQKLVAAAGSIDEIDEPASFRVPVGKDLRNGGV